MPGNLGLCPRLVCSAPLVLKKCEFLNELFQGGPGWLFLGGCVHGPLPCATSAHGVAEVAFHFGDDGGPAEGLGGAAGGGAEALAEGGIEQGFRGG